MLILKFLTLYLLLLLLDTLDSWLQPAGDDANFSTTVTNSIAAKLPLAGGTMTGAIAMGSNKITGLGTPTATTDAATKAYADTMIPLAGGTNVRQPGNGQQQSYWACYTYS